jgi:hypothetical protein
VSPLEEDEMSSTTVCTPAPANLMVNWEKYLAYVVAAWLGGIIVNLLSYSGYYDVALRDFGLMLAALTLARLASKYDPPGLPLSARR